MSDIRKEFDVRVVNYHLRRRTVSTDEYRDFLASLPDDADEAVETEVRFDNTYERRADEESG